MSEQSETLLDLRQPRTVALEDRGRTYLLHCRRITDRDWSDYFSRIRVTSEQKGNERINVVDTTTPRIALAEAVLNDAEGYKVAGGAELVSLPDWQQRIPMAHRQMLGVVLADARPSTADDELLIHPEGEVVSIDCTWTALPNGGMQRFVGLKHIFATPTEEQHRRYTQASSRAVVVGGSRGGKTVYPGAHAMLATLYDELIVSVEGYANLDSDSEQIAREMDMLHKVIAAQEIFQPQSTVRTAEAQE